MADSYIHDTRVFALRVHKCEHVLLMLRNVCNMRIERVLTWIRRVEH